jgi:hypothetical protein
MKVRAIYQQRLGDSLKARLLAVKVDYHIKRRLAHLLFKGRYCNTTLAATGLCSLVVRALYGNPERIRVIPW